MRYPWWEVVLIMLAVPTGIAIGPLSVLCLIGWCCEQVENFFDDRYYRRMAPVYARERAIESARVAREREADGEREDREYAASLREYAARWEREEADERLDHEYPRPTFQSGGVDQKVGRGVAFKPYFDEWGQPANARMVAATPLRDDGHA